MTTNQNHRVETRANPRSDWRADGIGTGENGEPTLVFASHGEAYLCCEQQKRLADGEAEFRVVPTSEPVTCSTKLPAFSEEARAAIEETGIDADDIAGDVADLMSGAKTQTSLLAECLIGADPDREAGWTEYVAACALAAAL